MSASDTEPSQSTPGASDGCLATRIAGAVGALDLSLSAVLALADAATETSSVQEQRARLAAAQAEVCNVAGPALAAAEERAAVLRGLVPPAAFCAAVDGVARASASTLTLQQAVDGLLLARAEDPTRFAALVVPDLSSILAPWARQPGFARAMDELGGPSSRASLPL
jgi:hypothetical protein